MGSASSCCSASVDNSMQLGKNSMQAALGKATGFKSINIFDYEQRVHMFTTRKNMG